MEDIYESQLEENAAVLNDEPNQEELEEKIVPVKYYDTIVEAQVDKDVLLRNGIECTITPESDAGLYPVFDDTEKGISLLVFESELDNATLILDEYHAVADDNSPFPIDEDPNLINTES